MSNKVEQQLINYKNLKESNNLTFLFTSNIIILPEIIEDLK